MYVTIKMYTYIRIRMYVIYTERESVLYHGIKHREVC